MLTYTFSLLPFFLKRTHLPIQAHTLNCCLSFYLIFNETFIQSHFQMESNNTIGGDLLNHFYFEYAAFRYVYFSFARSPHKQATAYFVVLIVIFTNVFSFHFINTFSVPSSSFSFLIPIKSDTISRPHLIIINVHEFFFSCLCFLHLSTFCKFTSVSLSLSIHMHT